ncbi:MAG: hypothetical protein ACRDD1_21290, partial [Planctomycetia bacterium]
RPFNQTPVVPMEAATPSGYAHAVWPPVGYASAPPSSYAPGLPTGLPTTPTGGVGDLHGHQIFDLGAGNLAPRYDPLRITDDVQLRESVMARSRRDRRRHGAGPSPVLQSVSIMTAILGVGALGFFTRELTPVLSKIDVEKILRVLTNPADVNENRPEMAATESEPASVKTIAAKPIDPTSAVVETTPMEPRVAHPEVRIGGKESAVVPR